MSGTQRHFLAIASSVRSESAQTIPVDRLDPLDQAHLDAAAARDPAQAAALRRHFDEQNASTNALRKRPGAAIVGPRSAGQRRDPVESSPHSGQVNRASDGK